MTVETDISRSQHDGDGSTKTFATGFRFLQPGDLVVTLINLDGSTSILGLGSDYTVSGAGNDNGGAVTLVDAPAANQDVLIFNDPPATQKLRYSSTGRFPAESHQDALDKLVMLIQRTREMLARTLRLNDADPGPLQFPPALQRAERALIFDASGNPTAQDIPALKPFASAAEALAGLLTNKGMSPSTTLAQIRANQVDIEAFAQGDDLSVNFGPALLRAQSQLPPGSVVRFRSPPYRLASPVPGLSRITLECPGGRCSGPAATENLYLRRNVIKVAASAFTNVTIDGVSSLVAFPNVGDAVEIRGLIFIRDGLTLPFASASAARTGLALYAGTVFQTVGFDFRAERCMFVGFNKPNDGNLSGKGRVDFRDCQFDCNNGPRRSGSLDINRSVNDGAWPFMTALIPGLAEADHDVLHRPGYASEDYGRSDGTIMIGTLSYGYKKGYRFVDCPNIRLVGPWLDHGNPMQTGAIGIEMVGNCSGAEIHAAMSVAIETTLKIDTGNNLNTYGQGTGPTPTGLPIRVIGGSFNGATYGIDHVSGDLVIIGANFDGANQVRVGTGIRSLIYMGCTFARGGGFIVPNSATLAKIRDGGGNAFVDCPELSNAVPFTPTVAAPGSSGTVFGAVTAAYMANREVVEVWYTIPVTTAGSSLGDVTVTLPNGWVGAAGFVSYLSGSREGAGGDTLKATVSAGANIIAIRRFDNTTVITSGTTLYVHGRLRRAV